jgi:hypothetical protein
MSSTNPNILQHRIERLELQNKELEETNTRILRQYDSYVEATNTLIEIKDKFRKKGIPEEEEPSHGKEQHHVACHDQFAGHQAEIERIKNRLHDLEEDLYGLIRGNKRKSGK